MQEWVMNPANTPKDVLEALIQIGKGMNCLKDKQVFHGDIKMANVMFGVWKGQNRFDIIDFGGGQKLTEMTSIDKFFHLMDLNLSGWDLFNDEFNSMQGATGDQVISIAKKILMKRDAMLFGTLMEYVVNNYFIFRKEKSDSILEEVKNMGKRIQETKNLGNVVQELENLLKKTV